MRVEGRYKSSSTTHHYNLRRDNITVDWITPSDADIAMTSMTSHAPAVSAQQPEDIGGARTHRLLQVPDPGERWHHASRSQRVHSVASRQRQDREKTRSAVIIISSVFFTLTVISTLALGIFCRKRNTVFVLQKCEQRDYAVAAADDEDELSTDCDSTTLPTVVAHTEVARRVSQQRRDLNRTSVAPTTPDLSLFCTSITGKRNRTGRGSTRRDKVTRRASSWIELDPAAATLSTAVPVECTDDDTDDDIKYRGVTRDVVSASSLLWRSSSGWCDAGRFQRSTSLDADVCRFALTCGAASSQPLMTRRRELHVHDSQLPRGATTPSPSRELAASDVVGVSDSFKQRETSTFEQSVRVVGLRDDVQYRTCETMKETPTIIVQLNSTDNSSLP